MENPSNYMARKAMAANSISDDVKIDFRPLKPMLQQQVGNRSPHGAKRRPVGKKSGDKTKGKSKRLKRFIGDGLPDKVDWYDFVNNGYTYCVCVIFYLCKTLYCDCIYTNIMTHTMYYMH